MTLTARVRFAVAIALAASLLGGCKTGTRPSETTNAELANLVYSGIHDESVELENGNWAGEPYVVGGASRANVELVRELRRDADVDGDGTDDAVVVLLESSGGTGVNSHVAVVGRADGEATNLGTALLGDRVQLESLRVSKQQIVAEVVQAGPEDALCCPTQLATYVFALRDGELQEIAVIDNGTLSLASIASGGWVLSHFDWNLKAPAQPAVTLEIRDGNATGSSGCNRYVASVTAGDAPGKLLIGQPSTTRMACPGVAMGIERDYLHALAAVTHYGFANAKLSLGGKVDGQYFTLLFDPVPAPEPVP